MGDVSKYVDDIAGIIRRAQVEARAKTLRECGNAIDTSATLFELDWNHADAVRCARRWIQEADSIEAGG